MKKLLYLFLVFLGVLHLLDRVDWPMVALAFGAMMALMTFLHILATPDSP
jgi:hypothetical protein